MTSKTFTVHLLFEASPESVKVYVFTISKTVPKAIWDIKSSFNIANLAVGRFIIQNICDHWKFGMVLSLEMQYGDQVTCFFLSVVKSFKILRIWTVYH